MRKNTRSAIFSFCLLGMSLFSISANQINDQQNSYQIIKDMFAKTKQIHTMKYVMRKEERIEGKMVLQQTAVKLMANPLKVYLKQELPKAGLEVLYVQGSNNNHAIVNTNGFPWVNLNLDPMGNIMRENQHHTLFESGYPHLISILEHLTAKYGNSVEDMITNGGVVQWKNRNCYHITVNNPNFKISKYTVKAGENILTIAARSKLSEYMILELNKGISGYNDVTAGQVINVPNDYSPKLELMIDKTELVPLMIKVYDDKGLYEHYEYYQVQINPTFKSNEFDKSFPEYHF